MLKIFKSKTIEAAWENGLSEKDAEKKADEVIVKKWGKEAFIQRFDGVSNKRRDHQ